jgi:hypothetical protein
MSIVLTAWLSDLAERKDNQYLQSLVQNTLNNLQGHGLIMENVLADAAYSRRKNYTWLKQHNLKSFIPKHGTYKGCTEGFSYFKEDNYWLCPNNQKVTFRNQRKACLLQAGTMVST